MIHELNEIIKNISPDEIIHSVKQINTDDILMKISSNYNHIESTIRNYHELKSRTIRAGRILRFRYKNRIKKIRFLK